MSDWERRAAPGEPGYGIVSATSDFSVPFDVWLANPEAHELSVTSVPLTNTYYLMDRDRLVYSLERFRDEPILTVADILRLRRERSNLVVLPDGRVVHPQPETIVGYGGQFSTGAVAVAGRPYGILLPQVGHVHGINYGEFKGILEQAQHRE